MQALGKILATVPTGTREILDSVPRLYNTTKDRHLIAVNHVLNTATFKAGHAGAFVNIHSKEWRAIYGWHAPERLRELEELGILEINHYYKKDEQTKRYAINFKLLKNKFESFLIDATQDFKDKTPKIDARYSRVAEIANACTFNTKRMEFTAIEHANSNQVWNNHRVKFEDQIDKHYFKQAKVWNSSGRYFITRKGITRERLLATCYNERFTLIKNGNTVYYMPLEEFKQMKRVNSLYYSARFIGMVKTGYFYAHRDNTTKRLHSIFSATPKIFLPHVKYRRKNFHEFDFANSQFMLLGYAMLGHLYAKKFIDNKITELSKEHFRMDYTRVPVDMDLFYRLSCNGELYEYIAKYTGKSRGQVKQMLFETLFGRETGASQDTPRKAILRELFPSVLGFMDKYKRKYGYKDFPCELQRIESTLVVGVILPALWESRITAATKHDSFLINPVQKNKAEKIIREICDLFLGKNRYNLHSSTFATPMIEEEMIDEISKIIPSL
jgi:hypothetical protein